MSIQNELTKLYKKLSEEGLNKEAQRLAPFIKEARFGTMLNSSQRQGLRELNRMLRKKQFKEAADTLRGMGITDASFLTAIEGMGEDKMPRQKRIQIMKQIKAAVKLMSLGRTSITMSQIKQEADKDSSPVAETSSETTQDASSSETAKPTSETIKNEKGNEGATDSKQVSEDASPETADSKGKSYDSITENSPVQLTGSYRKYKVKKVTMKDDYIEKIHLTDDKKASYTVNKADSQFKDIYKQLLDMGYPEDPGEPKSMTSDSTKAYQAKKSKVQNQLIDDLKNTVVLPYVSGAVVGQTVDFKKLLVTDGSYKWAVLEDNKTSPNHITSSTYDRVYFKGYDSKSSRGLGLEVSERKPLPAKNNSAFKILVEKANSQLGTSITIPPTPENNGPGNKDYVISNTI